MEFNEFHFIAVRKRKENGKTFALYSIFAFGHTRVLFDVHTPSKTITIREQNSTRNLSIWYSDRMFEQADAGAP